MSPKVSVVMACYKEPVEWLNIAVDSILNQSFDSLELIVVVDNPEHSDAIAELEDKKESDNRLKIIINDRNIGLPKSLNRGFEIATGDYFARMDADDIAYPNRIKVQVERLENDPSLDLLGTAITNIDSNGTALGVKQYLTSPVAVRKAIYYRSVACHPTWLMRKKVFETIEGYRYFPSSEDYDFLYRVIDSGFTIGNLSEPLLYYRLHDASMTSALSNFQYSVKHYIQELHFQRQRLGSDQYSEETSLKLKSNGESSGFAHGLVTKARKAEESKNYLALALWGSLAVIFSGSGASRLKSFLGFNYVKWRYEH